MEKWNFYPTDDDGNEIRDPETVKRYHQAIMLFGLKFAEYVKEIDKDLWKRAGDYAASFTKVDGVEFIKDDE
jgi:hypothetical protein